MSEMARKNKRRISFQNGLSIHCFVCLFVFLIKTAVMTELLK